VAAGHGVEADRHGRAHDLAGEGHADADRVAAHEVLLQLAQFVGGDVGGGELAEARGDPVGHLLLGDDACDDVVGRVDALARGPAEGDLGPAARHREDIFDAQRGVTDRDLCHGDGLL
jgi:hypothetical protein